MPRPSRPPRFHGNSLKRNLSIGELNSVVTYLYTPIRPSTEQVLFSPAKRKKSACRRYQKTRKQESPTGHLPTVGFPSLHIRPPFLPNCHLQHKQYRVTGPVPSIPLFFFPFFVLPIVKGKKISSLPVRVKLAIIQPSENSQLGGSLMERDFLLVHFYVLGGIRRMKRRGEGGHDCPLKLFTFIHFSRTSSPLWEADSVFFWFSKKN